MKALKAKEAIEAFIKAEGDVNILRLDFDYGLLEITYEDKKGVIKSDTYRYNNLRRGAPGTLNRRE